MKDIIVFFPRSKFFIHINNTNLDTYVILSINTYCVFVIFIQQVLKWKREVLWHKLYFNKIKLCLSIHTLTFFLKCTQYSRKYKLNNTWHKAQCNCSQNICEFCWVFTFQNRLGCIWLGIVFYLEKYISYAVLEKYVLSCKVMLSLITTNAIVNSFVVAQGYWKRPLLSAHGDRHPGLVFPYYSLTLCVAYTSSLCLI